MKILKTTVYTGPNIYSRQSVIRYVISREQMEGVSVSAQGALLALSENTPSDGRWGTFARRVSRGECPTGEQAFLEIFFRLHEIMGVPLDFAEIRSTQEAGNWMLLARMRDRYLARRAMSLCLAISNQLRDRLEDNTGDTETLQIHTRISNIVRKAQHEGLNFDSQACAHAAEKRGISWRYIGRGMLELGQGRSRKRIRSAVTSETSLIAARIAGDKAMTSALLEQVALPVPRQELVHSLGEMEAAAGRIGFPLVVKPLSGSEGKGVTACIADPKELESAYRRARQHSETVIVENFIPGKDFRILVVGEEAIAATERVPAHVIGDGKNDIQSLVAEENQRPRRDGTLLYKIKLDEAVEEMLARQGHSLQSIPREGETVFLRSTANFSTGGVPLDVTDLIHPDNRRMAVRAARTVGLDVAGVDFITPDITASYRLNGGAICEVNALPGLRLHIAPERGEKRDVAGRIVEALFPKNSAGVTPITAVFGRQSKQVTAFMLAHLLSFSGKTVGISANGKAYIGGDPRDEGKAPSVAAQANLILRDGDVDTMIFEIPFRGLLQGGLGFERCNLAILLGLESASGDASQATELASAMGNVLALVDNTVIVNADDAACVACVKDIPHGRLFYVSLEQDNPIVREHMRIEGRALFLQTGASGEKIMLHLGGKTQPFLDVARVPILIRHDHSARIRSAMCASAAALSMGAPVAQLSRGLEMLETPFLSAAGCVMEVRHDPFTVVLAPTVANGLRQITGMTTKFGDRGQKLALIPAPFLVSEAEDCAPLLRTLDLLVIHGSKAVRQPAIAAAVKLGIDREIISQGEDEDAALSAAWAALQPGDWLGVLSDSPTRCASWLTQLGSRVIQLPAQAGKSMSHPPLWTGKELALATGGIWIGSRGEDVRASGVCYYPRQLQPGDVFITTAPDHWKKDFADTAPLLKKMRDQGAVAAVVDHLPEDAPQDLPILLVENTRQALNDLGRFARGRLKGKAICVTGSAGKSTTKEMLYFVLGRQGLTTASRKNFNHGDGVPLSIAQTPADAAYGVYEFCVDAPSVTLPKAMIARPDVAIVTTVEHDHLMFYKTLEGVADQKSLLFNGLVPGGTVILNRDNALFDRLLAAAKAKGVRSIMSFGTHAEADVRATAFDMSDDGSRVKALVHGVAVEYQLKQPGRHMIMNSLAVLAAVEAVGGDVVRAAADLGDYAGLAQRVERHRVEVEDGHFDIIDDSFSANPASIRAGLDVLSLQRPGAGGRRLAVLGEIKELGKDSPAIHAALSDSVMAAKVERLFTIGDDMLPMRDKLPKQILGAHCASGVELSTAVAAEIRAGDVILVKGSRRTPENTAPTIKALLAKAAKGPKKKVDRTDAAVPGDRKDVLPPAAGAGRNLPPIWSGAELVRATGGTWLGAGKEAVKAYGVCFYFSQVRKGDLFITTSRQNWGGAYQDNHDCLKDLPSRGAAAAIVDFVPDAAPAGLPILLVENTRDALDALGRYARQRFKGKVVCITGSSGKSTTKEALKFVLEHQGPTAASRLNFNHDEGVPLSLAQTSADAEYGVFEYAADPPQPASRPPKHAIARPNVAIVTLIAPDHLKSYQTLEGVARQKAMLFDGLVQGGYAILNRDDEFFTYLRDAAYNKGVDRIISFGTHPEANVRALSVDMDRNGSHIRAVVGDADVQYILAQPGHHMVMNSLAVLAGVYALGADIRRAAADLADFGGLPQRTERHHIQIADGWMDLIDDSFSTNPASVCAALAVLQLAGSSQNGRRIAVLGEMHELGDDSPRLHAGLAQAVLDAGVDRLFTIGDDMEHLREHLPPAMLGPHASDGASLAAAVTQEVRAGDVVLVKGSLRTHHYTDPVVQSLLRQETQTGVKPFEYLPGTHSITLDSGSRHQAQRLEVLLVGDTSFGENYQAKNEARGAGNILRDKGYDYPLERMRSFLEHADLTIANLETPLTDLDRSPFEGKKSFVHWSDVRHAPAHLKKHNIFVTSLANNHCFDYGKEGFDQTLDALQRSGMVYLGAGRSATEACRPLRIEAPIGSRIFRMAIIGAYEYGRNAAESYSCYAEGEQGGLCALDDRVLQVVRQLKRQEPDTLVIVFPHWGPNYKWKTALQAQMADALLQAGADLIIGHGAHMLQEIERHDQKWVVFSIGNFMFNSPGRYAKYQAPPFSLAARLVITREGTLLGRALELFPIMTDNLRTGYQTRFVTREEFDDICGMLSEKGHLELTRSGPIRLGADEFGHFLRLDLGTV